MGAENILVDQLSDWYVIGQYNYFCYGGNTFLYTFLIERNSVHNYMWGMVYANIDTIISKKS